MDGPGLKKQKRRCMIVGESMLVQMLVRYNGIGTALSHDEKEILMVALYRESEENKGLAFQAELICRKQLRLGDSDGPK
jgi:hypothetical protein